MKGKKQGSTKREKERSMGVKKIFTGLFSRTVDES